MAGTRPGATRSSTPTACRRGGLSRRRRGLGWHVRAVRRRARLGRRRSIRRCSRRRAGPQPLARRAVRVVARNAGRRGPRSDLRRPGCRRRDPAAHGSGLGAGSSSRRCGAVPAVPRRGATTRCGRCAQELRMPVHVHSGPADKASYGAHVGIYVTEVRWWSTRPLWFLLWSGVFERYPRPPVRRDGVRAFWAARPAVDYGDRLRPRARGTRSSAIR